jgi:hypothetical protein
MSRPARPVIQYGVSVARSRSPSSFETLEASTELIFEGSRVHVDELDPDAMEVIGRRELELALVVAREGAVATKPRISVRRQRRSPSWAAVGNRRPPAGP